MGTGGPVLSLAAYEAAQRQKALNDGDKANAKKLAALITAQQVDAEQAKQTYEGLVAEIKTLVAKLTSHIAMVKALQAQDAWTIGPNRGLSGAGGSWAMSLFLEAAVHRGASPQRVSQLGAAPPARALPDHVLRDLVHRRCGRCVPEPCFRLRRRASL